MSIESTRELIQADLVAAHLPVEAEDSRIVTKLAAFLNLLERWNRAYNLTAVRDRSQMHVQHLADCIAAVPAIRLHVDSQRPLRVLDVGSGGGLPGAVFSILHPAWRVDCIDAVGKKAAFIRQVAGELDLPALHAIHGRVEQLDLNEAYDLITSRAFSDLRKLVEVTRHLRRSSGIWAAMKGKVPEQELSEVPNDLAVKAIHSINVRNMSASRCLIIIDSKH